MSSRAAFRTSVAAFKHIRVWERLSSPRSMLRYVILLNIHEGIGFRVWLCMTVVL